MASELRQHARYSRQIEVQIKHLVLLTTNVSLSGIQLECPALRYRGFQAACKDNHVVMKLTLPGSDELIDIKGQVVYTSPVEDDYLIGIDLVGFTKIGMPIWKSYIASLRGSRILE